MIRRIAKRINSIFLLFGINLRKTRNTLLGMPYFFKTYREIKKQNKKSNDFRILRLVPQLDDLREESGVGRGQYFNQDLFIAQQIFKRNPVKHVDIGSRIDGFVAHVASFRQIEIFDIRPYTTEIENVVFRQSDFMRKNKEYQNYTDSLSSLHAIEHFGLGRYGDSIDIDGHKKAITNIYNMLQKGGFFYFSVPFGKHRIDFNANRIFGLKNLMELIKIFEIISFSYIDDQGFLHKHVNLNDGDIQNNYNCSYGCAIFELSKI